MPHEASSPQLLDTSVIARYLLQDSPGQFERAAALITSGRLLFITTSSIAELGFLFTSFYKASRPEVVETLIELLNHENIEVLDVATDVAIEALRLCAPSRHVSFADAMLWAVAHAEVESVWTFDKRFPAVGLSVMEP